MTGTSCCGGGDGPGGGVSTAQRQQQREGRCKGSTACPPSPTHTILKDGSFCCRIARKGPEEGRQLDRLVLVLIDKVRGGRRPGASRAAGETDRISRPAGLTRRPSFDTGPTYSSSRRPMRSRLRRTGTRPAGRLTGAAHWHPKSSSRARGRGEAAGGCAGVVCSTRRRQRLQHGPKLPGSAG